MMKDNPNQVEELAKLFKILGSTLRIRIMVSLAKGSASVGVLAQHLGVEQSTLSQQLKTMRYNGLLQTVRKGQHMYYSIADEKALQLLAESFALY